MPRICRTVHFLAQGGDNLTKSAMNAHIFMFFLMGMITSFLITFVLSFSRNIVIEYNSLFDIISRDKTLEVYQQIETEVEKQEEAKDGSVDSSTSLSETLLVLSENNDPAMCMKQSLKLYHSEW